MGLGRLSRRNRSAMCMASRVAEKAGYKTTDTFAVGNYPNLVKETHVLFTLLARLLSYSEHSSCPRASEVQELKAGEAKQDAMFKCYNLHLVTCCT